jgi:hypothetical protein
MRRILSTTLLLASAASAQAHVADVAILQHALEHGWQLVLLLPLLLLWPLRRQR